MDSVYGSNVCFSCTKRRLISFPPFPPHTGWLVLKPGLLIFVNGKLDCHIYVRNILLWANLLWFHPISHPFFKLFDCLICIETVANSSCRQHLGSILSECWAGKNGWPGFITIISRTWKLLPDSWMPGNVETNIVAVVPQTPRMWL